MNSGDPEPHGGGYIGLRSMQGVDTVSYDDFSVWSVTASTIAGQEVSRIENNIDNLARWISRLSPFGCLQNTCVSLAQTGMQRELSLREATEKYYRETTDYAYMHHKEKKKDLDPVAGPAFRVQETSISSAIAESFVDIGILIIMGVLFFLIGYVGFLRMEIV